MQGIIFIGLQASGKSSFYLRDFYKTHLRLNMDMLKTRHRESLLFNACLESKQPVVIDNTNPTQEERRRYIEGFKRHRFDIVGYYFSSVLEECLARNALRIPEERIPDVGVKGTYKKLMLPEYTEGYSQLYYVTLRGNDFIVEKWKNEI